MTEILSSILSGGAYAWLTLGLVLMMVEIAITSNWLLWPGIAAIITAVFVYFFPDMPWTSAVLVFVVFSLILLFVGRRYVRFAASQPTDVPHLNARAARMVGRRCSALLDAHGGLSRVQIDGIEWPVRLEDNTPIRGGEILEITHFDGTTLVARAQTP